MTSPHPTSPPPPTILLVDDDQAMISTLADILAVWGYRCRPCTRPREALDGLNGADALIADVVMPGLTGFELAREARRRRPHLPVLLVSAYARPDLEEEAAGLGLPLLGKPIDPRRLVDWLSTEVGR